MNLREFKKVGHWPTLLAAFLYFDISFMVWMLVGSLIISISADFPDMTTFQKGLVVGLPPLGGAILRLVLGFSTDYFGGRRSAIAGMLLTMVALAGGWLGTNTFPELVIVSLCLGIAGGSFAVALPLASRWYPPQYQGLALGIAGAGNSGTAIATLACPILARYMSWHAVFGLAMIPMGVVFVFFVLFAKDSPNQPPPKKISDYVAFLKYGDAFRICLLYGTTFGTFVGLASFLNLFFREYGLEPIVAGIMVTICVVAGSFLRPVGGYLADKMGGVSLLTFLFAGIGILFLDLATSPPLPWAIVLLTLIMAQCGLGNGAVFQLVPQRFKKEIGVATGLFGAWASFAGFLLPTMLGAVKQTTGSYGLGFLVVSMIAFACVVVVIGIGRSWEGVYVGRGGRATTQPA